MAKLLAIDAIEVDADAQARAEISETTVDEYTDAINDGAEFPPLVVFFDGAKYWLADGFHRWRAARRADRVKVACDVRDGGKRDAILHAVGANSSHGLKRSNADKRRAVSILLLDKEWQKKSDRWIAAKAAVGNKLVGDVRRELCSEHSCDSSEDDPEAGAREGQDGKKRKPPAKRSSKGKAAKGKPSNGKPESAPAPADDAEGEVAGLRGEPVPVSKGMTPEQFNDAIYEMRAFIVKTVQMVPEAGVGILCDNLRNLADEFEHGCY